MLVFPVFAKENSRRPPLFDPSPYILTSLPPYLLLDRHRDENPATVSGYPMRIVILSERSESKDLSYNRKCGYYRHAICHRDEKRVTISPLDSALTNSWQLAENTAPLSPLDSALTDCDAHKSFRMRSYENCRVSPAFPCSFLFRQSPSPLPGLSSPLCFHALMNCKLCNSFGFTFIQNAGGCRGCCASSTLGRSDLRTPQRVFHLSPLFSSWCALFCATAAMQLLWNHFVAHSFRHYGGVYPPFHLLYRSQTTPHQSNALSAGNASCR
jgi:hypothetical protein